MSVVSITSALDVVSSDDASGQSTGALLAGYSGRKHGICRRLLTGIAGAPWIPSVAARLPLGLCAAEIEEALIARDPTVLDVRDVRWGRELWKTLGRRTPWSWLLPGSAIASLRRRLRRSARTPW